MLQKNNPALVPRKESGDNACHISILYTDRHTPFRLPNGRGDTRNIVS